MSDDGTGVRRVAGLHPTQEGQEGGRVLGNAVVRPRRELELANFPLLARAVLKERGSELVLLRRRSAAAAVPRTNAKFSSRNGTKASNK